IATKYSDPKLLQNMWVAGGGGGRRGRGGPTTATDARTVTASVKLASGETVEGRLLRIDDFLIALRLADDSIREFTRNGDNPKVEVRDPMKGHRDLLAVYTDKDIHDV